MDRSLNVLVSPSLTALSAQLLKPHRYWLGHLSLLLCDQALIVFSFILAYWMRYLATWPSALKPIVTEVATENFVAFNAFLPLTLLLVAILTLLFETKGLYRLPRGSGTLDYSSIILSSTVTGIAFLIVVVFLYRPFYYSRLIFAFAGLNIVVLLYCWRSLLVNLQRWFWANGLGQERVLVVGGNGLGRQVMNSIALQPHLGYSLVGYLANSIESHPEKQNYPYLGPVEDLQRVFLAQKIDEVILALPFWEHGQLPQLVQMCRTLNVDFRIAPDLYELSFDQVNILQISGLPLIGLKELSIKGWNLALKRAIDVALILLTAPFTLPLAFLLGLLIRLDSPGPAFFRQTRIGKNGLPFTCYKFRTMVTDAEKLKAQLAALNEADGPLFKMRNDPRITRFGGFLRRCSLDELPQLWNILQGEMSLVGPRPGLPSEVEKYAPWHLRRLEVTPGLTGLWQVLGRSDLSFDEMVRLDIYYAENWTVGMDLKIILKTIPAVLFSKGAY